MLGLTWSSRTPDMKEKAKSLGLVHVDFDGCSEIWVRSWDDWMSFYQVCSCQSSRRPDSDMIIRVQSTPRPCNLTALISWNFRYMSWQVHIRKTRLETALTLYLCSRLVTTTSSMDTRYQRKAVRMALWRQTCSLDRL